MQQKQFFLQMSGVPGAGKTTVATAIGKATNGVIIDHDVSKTALLGEDLPPDVAGRASYAVLKAMARHLLVQGHSVIFDSPCFYQELLDIGVAVVNEHGVEYLYIECVTADLDEIDRRLRTRTRYPSQVAAVVDQDRFLDWMANMKRPSDYLRLNTSGEMDASLQTAVSYVYSKIGL